MESFVFYFELNLCLSPVRWQFPRFNSWVLDLLWRALLLGLVRAVQLRTSSSPLLDYRA